MALTIQIPKNIDEIAFIMLHYPVRPLGKLNKELLEAIDYPPGMRILSKTVNEYCERKLRELGVDL